MEIKGLRAELNDLRSGLEAVKLKINPNYLYTNKEIRLILGVDERLIKKYRDNGFLSYYRQDDKYWYRGADILDFLKRRKRRIKENNITVYLAILKILFKFAFVNIGSILQRFVKDISEYYSPILPLCRLFNKPGICMMSPTPLAGE